MQLLVVIVVTNAKATAISMTTQRKLLTTAKLDFLITGLSRTEFWTMIFFLLSESISLTYVFPSFFAKAKECIKHLCAKLVALALRLTKLVANPTPFAKCPFVDFIIYGIWKRRFWKPMCTTGKLHEG